MEIMSDITQELKNLVESYAVVHSRFVKGPSRSPDEIAELGEFKQMTRIKTITKYGLLGYSHWTDEERRDRKATLAFPYKIYPDGRTIRGDGFTAIEYNNALPNIWDRQVLQAAKRPSRPL